jgi:DNA-binding transcriptional ArsR family regulator
MKDGPRVNAVGDLELTDPAAMRAVAEPTRLALFDRVRREPATAAALSELIGEPEASIRALLAELEAHGLVSQDGDRWRAVARGIVFEIPDDPDGQRAARELSTVMMLAYDDLPRRWVAATEPLLDIEWARAAGLFNARVALTPDELRGLQEGLEDVLAPFLTREPGDVPADARPVRVLGYFLPEA